MQALEHRVPPPLLALAIAAAMAAAMLDPGPARLPAGWSWGLAGGFFVAAAALGFPAFAAFGKAGTTINPVLIDRASSLVTTGAYRFTRNPMYVALVFLLCAWAAWLAVPPPWIGPAVFVAFITRFQIVPEERTLTAKFGAAYADYRKTVRRWL